MSTFVEKRSAEEVVQEDDDWESRFDASDSASLIPVFIHQSDMSKSGRTNWWGDSDDEVDEEVDEEFLPPEKPSQSASDEHNEEPCEVIQIIEKKSFADKIDKVIDFLFSKCNLIQEVQLGLNHKGGKVSLRHTNIEPFGDIKTFLQKAKVYAAGHGKQQNITQLETAFKKAETDMRLSLANVNRIKENGGTIPESELKRVIGLNEKVTEKKKALERAKTEVSERKNMKKNEEIKEILTQFVGILNRNSNDSEIFISEFQTACAMRCGTKKKGTVKTQVVKITKAPAPAPASVSASAPASAPAPALAPASACASAPASAPAPAPASAPAPIKARSIFRGLKF